MIDELWSRRETLDVADPAVSGPILQAVGLLDSGAARVAEIIDDAVVVHEWLKRAILLFFATTPNVANEVGPFEIVDKVPLKTGLEAAGVRALPGSIIRWGSFIEPRTILMPSFVNIGARVGSGTMVDTWATVGSCAQVGRNVHLSGGVGLGGVLEPPAGGTGSYRGRRIHWQPFHGDRGGESWARGHARCWGDPQPVDSGH